MKKNIILGGVLLVLIVLAYAYQGPLKKWQSRLGGPNNILAKIDTAKIDKIELTRGGSTVGFENKNGAWIVAGTKSFPAKEEMITGFLDELNQAKTEKITLISSNKDKKGEFQTDHSGTAVKLFSAGKTVSELVIGKDGPDFMSSYISLKDLNDTYSVPVNLNKYLQSDLKNNVIFSSDKDKVNKLRFQYPKYSFTIEKKDGKWTGVMPYKFNVNNAKVEKIIGVMTSLSAEEIPGQKFEGTGLEKHLIIVQATGEGIDNTIMVGADNGQSLFYAKKGDADNIYLILKTDRDMLDQTMAKLR